MLLAMATPAWPALPVISSFTAQRGAVGSVAPWRNDTLRWSVSGATQVTIDPGPGNVTGTPYSQVSVSPTAPTRYVLTATNAEGSVTASVRVGYIPLVQLSADTWMTEHAIYHVPDPAVVTFPDYASVYAFPTIDNVYVPKLQALFPADYLMVTIAANNVVPSNVPIVTNRREVAAGIGNFGTVSPGVPNLCRYPIGGTVIPGSLGVFDHEIGHNWVAHLGAELGWGHWLSNATVGGQMATAYTDDGWLTVKRIAGTPATGFTWTAVGNNASQLTETFAAQDLYSLGLEAVFPDTWVLASPVYNADGTMGYASATKYDHAWAVGRNGPRLPSYATSDKRFRLGFVYVARSLTEIQDAYFPFEQSILHFTTHEQADGSLSTQVPFLGITRQRASASALLADLDGNATPAIAIAGTPYRISTDGAASVDFSASDADGPAPAVSLVPASPYATVAGSGVSFTGLPAGTHFFTLKAEDDSGKKAFDHFVIDVAPPGAFAFAPQSGVAPGAVVTSNTVTLAGIAAGTPIAAWGGSYSINGGSFRGTAGLANPGDTVALQQVAPAGNGRSTTATLLVGYTSGSFDVTTAPGVPEAPGIVSAIAGASSATVAFTAPLFDGGSVVLDYTATCAPVVTGATGTASPLVVSGLADGVLHACSVRARNVVGQGPPSGELAVMPGVAPVFGSAATASFTVNAPGTFTVVAGGAPSPALWLSSGTLPAGLAFTPGSGKLEGTPASGTAGTYPLVFTATNGLPPDATQAFTLTVAKVAQSISFAPIAARRIGDAPFALDVAGGGSGQPVVVVSSSPDVCAVAGTTVTVIAPGTCALSASQAGDADHAPAAPATVSFAVTCREAAGDCDADGIPDGVEGGEGRDPHARDNDLFSAGATSARLFAMQQYRDFLSREGDAAGITGWTDLLLAGTYTKPQVIEAFLNSAEFGGVIAPVVRLYFATFLRVPDYAGLTYNAGLVRNGTVSLQQLADFFTASPEFAATYGALDNTQFATLLYQNVLGRAPDQAGLDGWVAILNGGASRGSVLTGFSESPEYKANMANEVLVSMMYAGMLRRTPETAGYNGWLAALDSGAYTAVQMIDGFFLSVEYHDRFLP